jgi:hypothetical protein
MNAAPKFPQVHVKLTDLDNSFTILTRVIAVMKKAGISRAEIDAYLDAAMAKRLRPPPTRDGANR